MVTNEKNIILCNAFYCYIYGGIFRNVGGAIMKDTILDTVKALLMIMLITAVVAIATFLCVLYANPIINRDNINNIHAMNIVNNVPRNDVEKSGIYSTYVVSGLSAFYTTYYIDMDIAEFSMFTGYGATPLNSGYQFGYVLNNTQTNVPVLNSHINLVGDLIHEDYMFDLGVFAINDVSVYDATQLNPLEHHLGLLPDSVLSYYTEMPNYRIIYDNYTFQYQVNMSYNSDVYDEFVAGNPAYVGVERVLVAIRTFIFYGGNMLIPNAFAPAVYESPLDIYPVELNGLKLSRYPYDDAFEEFITEASLINSIIPTGTLRSTYDITTKINTVEQIDLADDLFGQVLSSEFHTTNALFVGNFIMYIQTLGVNGDRGVGDTSDSSGPSGFGGWIPSTNTHTLSNLTVVFSNDSKEITINNPSVRSVIIYRNDFQGGTFSYIMAIEFGTLYNIAKEQGFYNVGITNCRIHFDISPVAILTVNALTPSPVLLSSTLTIADYVSYEFLYNTLLDLYGELLQLNSTLYNRINELTNALNDLQQSGMMGGVFGWLRNAFEIVGVFLAIEIFPNFPLSAVLIILICIPLLVWILHLVVRS